MEIKIGAALEPRLLDIVARGALGGATVGVSICEGMSRVHLPHGNPPEQQRASDLLNNFGALTLMLERAPAAAGSPYSIRVSGGFFAVAEPLAYALLRADAVVASGRAELSAGLLALDFSRQDAGEYELLVYRLRDSFASGIMRLRISAA